MELVFRKKVRKKYDSNWLKAIRRKRKFKVLYKQTIRKQQQLKRVSSK